MENRKNRNGKFSHGQNGRNQGRAIANKSDKNENNGKEPVAGPSGGNSNNYKRRENTKPIGYKTLENVLAINGEVELILKLSSEMNGFLVLLDQQNIRTEMMCLILSALAKVSESSAELDTVQLLVHFYMKIVPKLNSNANFHRELKLYIADLSNHFAAHSSHRQKHVLAIQNLLIFLRRLQLTVYQNSFDAVRHLMQVITAQIEFINRKGNSLNEFIVEMLSQLNDSVEKFEEMRDETEPTEVLMEPPEDFRKISIYPSAFDILSNHEPFIRENVVAGKYVAGVDHYLDVQFRLLREDFVRPLRDGITEYRHIKSKPDAMTAAKFRIKDLNVYQNVQIVGSKMLHNEQVHSCKFDCTPFRNVRWQYNKRMMNGSLVCLSPDDFASFFFATVAGFRDPEKLAKGEFQIKLEIENTAVLEITPLINFVMVESHVYFEAYRHNLKVLQEFGRNNFPLEKYIVDVDKNISPPSYLTEDSVFVISNGLPESDPKAKVSVVEVLSKKEWPPCTDFNLDESQFEAFRAALTKQMVVIQGPPGTGKTYIGLRIVQVLLANTSKWPILIVCYTNHALDQFLEGIKHFCRDNELIRIGGKSQSQALEKFNLANIKSTMKSRREVPSFIHHGRMESNNQLKRIQEQISLHEKEIEHLCDTVLGHVLKDVIMKCNPQHYYQLELFARGREFNEGVLNWLGYGVNTDPDQYENNANAPGHDNDIEMAQEAYEAQETYEEPEMDEEEVREEERERIIDMSSDEEDEGRAENDAPTRVQVHLNNIVPLQYEDPDGFQQVKSKRKSIKNQFKREIKKTETMSEQQAAAVTNINALLSGNRWNLYRLWIRLYVQVFEIKIKALRDEYRNECLRFNGLRKQEDIEIVKSAKIIGMTTTGAAKYRHIIDGTKPKITIVEEAAEVLEAHIVTALCKQTDHLILIGDHLQLRPNPAVYELAKKFNLEISLFERLIKNQMEYFQLKQQHRMRPCISSLLVPHIYKQLLDHSSVEEYENVKGISKNMFFINHRQNESSMQETRSHMNMHEASFIVELCRYVILQGYDTSQVTILTTYSGQLHQIRQLMRGQNLLSGVRAAVVDNFQGEENDIILLSFVRSNDEANIGFLKISNRVNVALSRARKGLYCIGNFDCLAEKSKLWTNLMADLTVQESIGDALEIYCQNHTDYKSLVKSKNDFNVAPEGGCSRPCNYRLPCGHSCTSVCHIIDFQHVDIYKKCHKKCDIIICEQGHRCSKKCHYEEDCGDCTVVVKKERPECKHIVRVTCSGNPSTVHCYNPCEKTRSCGHRCTGICGAFCDGVTCNENVQAKSPCGHTVTVKCSDVTNDLKLLDACTEPCNVELKCGHLCKGSCGRCKYGRLHISCKEKCTRTLICGHPCPESCSIDCAPCKKKCTNSCVHSKCSLRCGDPCAPCMEKCAWRCDHLQCSKLCSEACDRELCEHPDKKMLRKCGHPSIGVCGEKMPSLCRICDKDEVEDIFFGNEDEEDARFIELADCKHIIEVNGLIHWMKSAPDAAESTSGGNNQNTIQFKKCPKCKTIIRHTKSLNTFIQASLKDIEQVKLKTCGKPKENKTTQINLNRKAKEILEVLKLFRIKTVQLSSLYMGICHISELNKSRFARPKQTLMELSNKFEMLETLKKICLEYEQRSSSHQHVSTRAIEQFEGRLRMVVSFIKDYRNCDQQRDDISTEISFLQLMGEVIVKSSVKPFNDTGKSLLNEAFEVANKYGSATESVRSEFMRLVNEACKHSSGLGISMAEKQMVLQAMGFNRGHWYKCPNGHIYCIADCGGAMVRSKCPDCGSVIGGENHSLERSNALATEMDGATAPAWPTNLQAQLRPFMD